MLLEDKEISRIRAVQRDNIRGFFGIRRIDRVPNARIRELCGMTKGVDERVDDIFSGCLAMWRGWRMTELVRESIQYTAC